MLSPLASISGGRRSRLPAACATRPASNGRRTPSGSSTSAEGPGFEPGHRSPGVPLSRRVRSAAPPTLQRSPTRVRTWDLAGNNRLRCQLRRRGMGAIAARAGRGSPNRIRTGAAAVKERGPGPLDDGGWATPAVVRDAAAAAGVFGKDLPGRSRTRGAAPRRFRHAGRHGLLCLEPAVGIEPTLPAYKAGRSRRRATRANAGGTPPATITSGYRDSNPASPLPYATALARLTP